MPRYVLVNCHAGLLHGDTARLPGAEPASPFDAALMLDRAAGRARRGYGTARRGSRDATLDVYRIDPVPALPTDAPDAVCLAHALRHGTHVATLISYIS